MVSEYLTLDNVIRGLTDNDFRRKGVRYVARHIRSALYNLTTTGKTDIMEEDADNLIILDGCRYDTFSEEYHVLSHEGDLERITSPASSSMGYMEETFGGQQFHDTVYVTANPHVEYIDSETFHSTISLLDDEYWNDEYNTVLPETVVDQARIAQEEYPQKRLILHFMQPHYPFIGPTGEQVSHRGYNQSLIDPDLEIEPVWAELRDNPTEEEIEAVKKAYRENLQIVLEHVDELLTDLDGKSILTADHGNLLGEHLWPVPMRDFGHPSSVATPALRHVPWYTIESDTRPTIVEEPPEGTINLSDKVVSDRLQALGYTEET